MTSYRQVLGKPGFSALLGTQFLALFNDQAFKIAASMVALGQGHADVIPLFGALFVLPFLLFGGYAGQVADTFRKRRIILTIKAIEIAIMALGVVALWSGQVWVMAAVVFLMGTHTSFMTPARLGIVPEMVDEDELSLANGAVDTSSFLAVIAGTAAGSAALALFPTAHYRIGLCLSTVALVGFLVSLLIRPARTVEFKRAIAGNPLPQLKRGMELIWKSKPLLLSCFALMFFWLVAALYQMNMLLFAKEQLSASETTTGLLIACLAIGIAIGSVTAGRLSGGRIQTGMAPFGGVGLGIFSMTLAHFAHTPLQAAFALAAMGFSGGIFMVPMGALMLKAAPEEERGRVIATSSFITTIGTISSAGILWLLHDFAHIPAANIFFICGVAALAASAIIAKFVLAEMVRFVLTPLIGLIYRIRVRGRQNIPATGPVLFVANHVSFIDGLLIAWSTPRNVRFLVLEKYYNRFRLIFAPLGAIPVPIGRRGVVETINRARTELAAGHAVCLFPEGNITRLGSILPFKRGVERILEGFDIPVVPIHLDQVWGSIFSYEGGKFFWKWPKRVPYPVTITYGAAMPSNSTKEAMRTAVVELGADAAEAREYKETLASRFIEAAKRYGGRLAVADSSGKELTFRHTLIAALLMAGRLKRKHRDEEMIGLLLPASAGAAIANLGVTLRGQVAVNLNFTAGPAMDSAIEQCGLRTILTSRTFLERIDMTPRPGMVYLEDLMAGFSGMDKAIAAAVAAMPGTIIERAIGPRRKTHDLATVIFSSGTTGTPKGVMLSHKNILSTIDSMGQVCEFGEDGCLAGLLPFFHSFGYTVTLWFPMTKGLTAVYHPNPSDAKAAGELVAKYRANLLLTTPTFALGYIRSCEKEQFASLRYVFAGAERLRESIANNFREKFGIELLEGYGATEMSPVVALNLPGITMLAGDGDPQVGAKAGTVGRPIPGVAVRAVHPETREPLPAGVEGLLIMRGPNRMLGYLNQPEKTAAAIQDGWYVTGDLGFVDAEGFLTITGRLARFSKIAGEMIPHEKVEQALAAAAPGMTCVVTSVPDVQRGERLMVLCVGSLYPLIEISTRLAASGLPKLWLPKRDSFFTVDAIPMLGSGKMDLGKARELALEFVARNDVAARKERVRRSEIAC